MTRFTLCLIFLWMSAASASAHQLPDKKIERRVQVSVKPDRVLVEYSLEMNETTLKNQLKTHGLQPAATVPEMWEQYQQVAFPLICKKLRLTIDGKAVRLKPLRASFSGWSHRHLVCLYKAEVQLERRSKIVVTDGNFAETPGDYRIALKGRSGAKILNATAPPMVSRAKRLALDDLTEMQRQAAARAEGDIVLEPLQ